MPIFQPGGTNTGYRAPAKSLTIKALQDRQKMMAESSASAAANAPPVANMWQGFGALANQLGDSVNMNRAASQESDARAQLAQLVAGIDPSKGASMEQIAAMQQLDPEFANAEYARAMEERSKVANREDEQTFRAGESEAERLARVAEQQATFGQQDKTASTLVKTNEAAAVSEDVRDDADAVEAAKVDAAAAQQAAANQTPEAQDAAAVAAGVMPPETAAANAAARRAKADAEAANTARSANDPYSGTGDIVRDYENGAYGPKGSPEAIKRRDDALASEQLKGTPTPAAGSDYQKKAEQTAAERHGKIIEDGNGAPQFLSDVKQLGELGKLIGTGKDAQVLAALGPYAAFFGMEDQIGSLGEMQAYQAIVDRMAPNMRPANSGSSSDFDAKQFLRSLPSLGNTAEGNAIVEATFTALQQHKVNAAAIAARAMLPPTDPNYKSWQTVDQEIAALPYPYDLYKEYVAGKPGADADGGAGGPGGGSPDIDAIIKKARGG